MRREAEGPGLRTFKLFLPGIWKHTQICHASNKSVIAWLSCCWWCSNSYNTLHYLMRCWLCSCFSQFMYYVVLWKEKVTAAYFPIWKKKKRTNRNKFPSEKLFFWKIVLTWRKVFGGRIRFVMPTGREVGAGWGCPPARGQGGGSPHLPFSASPLLLGAYNVLESFSQAERSWHPMQKLTPSGFSACWSPACDGSRPGWDFLTPQESLPGVSARQGKVRSQSSSRFLFFCCTLRQRTRSHLCRH